MSPSSALNATKNQRETLPVVGRENGALFAKHSVTTMLLVANNNTGTMAAAASVVVASSTRTTPRSSQPRQPVQQRGSARQTEPQLQRQQQQRPGWTPPSTQQPCKLCKPSQLRANVRCSFRYNHGGKLQPGRTTDAPLNYYPICSDASCWRWVLLHRGKCRPGANPPRDRRQRRLQPLRSTPRSSSTSPDKGSSTVQPREPYCHPHRPERRPALRPPSVRL